MKEPILEGAGSGHPARVNGRCRGLALRAEARGRRAGGGSPPGTSVSPWGGGAAESLACEEAVGPALTPKGVPGFVSTQHPPTGRRAPASGGRIALAGGKPRSWVQPKGQREGDRRGAGVGAQAGTRHLPLAESFLVLMILAAYSWPASTFTHLRTTEKAPLGQRRQRR